MLIVASSAFSLNVSSEHLALLPMTGSILVLSTLAAVAFNLTGRHPAWVCLHVSVEFSLSLFCCWHLSMHPTRRTSWETFLHGALTKGAWFSVGMLAPTLLSFLPYLLSGHSEFWITVYEAAVSYSEAQRSFANNCGEDA